MAGRGQRGPPPLTLVVQLKRPFALEPTPPPFAFQSFLVCARGDGDRFTLRSFLQGSAEEINETPDGGIPVGQLGPMALGRDTKDTPLADAPTEFLAQEFPLPRRQRGRPLHVEEQGDTGVHLVHVLTSRTTASRRAEDELRRGDLQIVCHPYHLSNHIPSLRETIPCMPLPPNSVVDLTIPGHAKELLRGLFEAMVGAAAPERVLPDQLPSPPPGRTLVLGAGKAAAAMARTVEERWTGPFSGLVVTRYGHGLTCERVEVVEAGHPLPDGLGEEAARRSLVLAQDLTSEDLVLALFSGGGSALLTLPAPGLTMMQLQEANRELLRSGAPIAQINCVRKHLSAIAGGRLAAACAPASVLTLLISDVPGDDPSVIASGPTVPDPTTFADARAVAEQHRLNLPGEVRRHLEEGRDETPKPGDPRLAGARAVVLGNPACALTAAADQARAIGLDPLMLGADLQGEARTLAAAHAEFIRSMHRRQGDMQGSKPAALLSGGEATVTVKGRGRGGRNTEYLLALALALGPAEEGGPTIFALAADTDGIDGTEENAGAFLLPDSLERSTAAGLNPYAFLEANDSYSFFEGLGDLLTTGPTRTNVNDFRAIIVL